MSHRKEAPFSGSKTGKAGGCSAHGPEVDSNSGSLNITIDENPKGRRAWHYIRANGGHADGRAGGSQTRLSRWLSPSQSCEGQPGGLDRVMSDTWPPDSP